MAVIKRGIVKSYDAASHKAGVQIAGSLAVWLDSVRVATNIPAADVTTGRQCSVLFLDPSNQDDAVIITIQGALPSNGQIIRAAASANLTLTTSFQDIVGATVTLPTVGDWEITAVFDFGHGVIGGILAEGQLLVAGVAQTSIAKLDDDAVRGTVTQSWKVTTTVVNTVLKLQARKTNAAGNSTCHSTDTTLTASTRLGTLGVATAKSATVVSETAFGQAAAAGSASPYSAGDHTHGTPTDPVPTHAALPSPHHTSFVQADADTLYETIGAVATHEALADPHTVYGALAQAETWASLQTFNAGIRLGAAQPIEDSTGTKRIELAVTGIFATGDVQKIWGHLELDGAPGFPAMIRGPDSVNRIEISRGGQPAIKLHADVQINTVNNNQGVLLRGTNPGMQWVNLAGGGKTLQVLNVSGSGLQFINQTDNEFIIDYRFNEAQRNLRLINLAPVPLAVTLSNGDNNSVDPVDATFLRVTGPSAAFAITGFATNGGQPFGRMLIVYNTTSQTMTIKHENTGSTALDRIDTLTGGDVAIAGPCIATFIYDHLGSTDRWILTSTRT